MANPNRKNVLDKIHESAALQTAVTEAHADGSEATRYDRNKRVEALDQALSEKGARSNGVGESRVFAAPEDDDIREGAYDWEKLTCNGAPIPEHLYGVIPYSLTDQGSAERNAGKPDAGVRVEILREPRDKAVERYRDDLRAGIPLSGQMERAGLMRNGDDPLIEGNDPFALLMKENVPPGMHGMMMSARTTKRQGLRRGRLIYRPLLDSEGHKIGLEGDSNEMFIAVVPQDKFEAEQGRHQESAREAAVRAQDKVREQNDRVLSSRVRNRAERRHPDDFEGLVDDTDDVASMPMDRREFIPGNDGTEFVG